MLLPLNKKTRIFKAVLKNQKRRFLKKFMVAKIITSVDWLEDKLRKSPRENKKMEGETGANRKEM